jgi:hypothetical protein
MTETVYLKHKKITEQSYIRSKYNQSETPVCTHSRQCRPRDVNLAIWLLASLPCPRKTEKKIRIRYTSPKQVPVDPTTRNYSQGTGTWRTILHNTTTTTWHKKSIRYFSDNINLTKYRAQSLPPRKHILISAARAQSSRRCVVFLNIILRDQVSKTEFPTQNDVYYTIASRGKRKPFAVSCPT